MISLETKTANRQQTDIVHCVAVSLNGTTVLCLELSKGWDV